MKFSTCFGASFGKNLISISPNFVLMRACGSMCGPPVGFLSSTAPTMLLVPIAKNVKTISVHQCRMVSSLAAGHSTRPPRLRRDGAFAPDQPFQRLLGRHLLGLLFASPCPEAIPAPANLNFDLEDLLVIGA